MLHIYQVVYTDFNGVEAIMAECSTYDEALRKLRELSYEYDTNGTGDWEIRTLIEIFV